MTKKVKNKKSKSKNEYKFLLKGPEAFLAFSSEDDLDQISDIDLIKISKLTYNEFLIQSHIESFVGARFLLDMHVVKALEIGLDILTKRKKEVNIYLQSCFKFSN